MYPGSLAPLPGQISPPSLLIPRPRCPSCAVARTAAAMRLSHDARAHLRRRAVGAGEIQADDVLGSYTLTLGAGTPAMSLATDPGPAPTPTPATSNPRKPFASQLGTAISLSVLGALFVLLGLVYGVLLCSQRRSKARAAKKSHRANRDHHHHHTKSKGRETPVSPIDKSSRAMSPSSVTTLAPSPTPPSPQVIYLDISPATVPPGFDEDDEDDMFFAPLSPLPPARTVQPRSGQHWKAIQDRWPGYTYARDHAVLEPIPGSPSAPGARRDVVSIYSTISLGAFGPPDERRASYLSVNDGQNHHALPARPMSTLSLHSISTPLGER